MRPPLLVYGIFISGVMLQHLLQILCPFCMKPLLLLLACCLYLPCCKTIKSNPNPGFELSYTSLDKADASEYSVLLKKAKHQVEAFFGKPFPQPFTVFIHPSRAALDSCWQKEWKLPDFHSECWMVASGVANKLDLLSPKVWPKSACEHRWEDSLASQQLIAHEMVHVYHGQHNASPDFSETDRIDFFVEGLAVYASGQCDSTRMSNTKHWIQDHGIPNSLDQCWTGPQKYGLSGSLVMFLDQKIGRKKLCSLLVYNQKDALLKAIGMSEPSILSEWAVWLNQ